MNQSPVGLIIGQQEWAAYLNRGIVRSSYDSSAGEVVSSRRYDNCAYHNNAACRIGAVWRASRNGKDRSGHSETSVYTRLRAYVPISVVVASHIYACHPDPRVAAEGDLEGSLELPNRGLVCRSYVVLSEAVCFNYSYDSRAGFSLSCARVSC